ncbi:MAG: ParA family protein [Gammaproteobacteria bacterium]|nr:ParA family protein [Gammaproteobacteria bacterium]
MRVWAVANQKGGVGKTTTVVSLGGIFAQRETKTLMIDMDPHGSMTSYFGHNPDTIEKSLYQLFEKKAKRELEMPDELVLATRFDNLYLLPASTALATLDRQLGAMDGMGLVITRTLKAMEHQFDNVMIDCPPQLGVLMVNALAACQHLIIPVQTEFLALKGLERMLRTLKMIAVSQKKQLDYTILATMFDRRTRASLNTLRVLRETYEKFMWKSVIPIDTQFREASRAGIPLPIRSPRDRGALAYELFLQDMLAKSTIDGFSCAVA